MFICTGGKVQRLVDWFPCEKIPTEPSVPSARRVKKMCVCSAYENVYLAELYNPRSGRKAKNGTGLYRSRRGMLPNPQCVAHGDRLGQIPPIRANVRCLQYVFFHKLPRAVVVPQKLHNPERAIRRQTCFRAVCYLILVFNDFLRLAPTKCPTPTLWSSILAGWWMA